METIIVHPRNQKEQATIEAVLKALDVAFHKQDENLLVPGGKTKPDTAGKPAISQADEVWKLE